ATAVREVEFVDNQGQLVRGSAWIQEQVGEGWGRANQLDAQLRHEAAKLYGPDHYSSDGAVRLIADPNQLELRKAVEEALVERAIFGETIDDHGGNLIMAMEGGKPKVYNIDLDYAFNEQPEPLWISAPNKGVIRKIMPALSGQQLSPETVSRVQSFVSKYDSDAGRQHLKDLGLTDAEVNAMLSRAKWFVDHRQFPPMEFSPPGYDGT
ncbi:MAG TPA: hypothetical protein V6D17_22485, partial [Candidatus Obscuribacterales bacterium]